MSLYAFDTDCVTLLLHGHQGISEKSAAHDPGDLAVTIVTVEEVLTGWYSQIRRAKKDDQMIRAYTALQQAVEFFARVRILPMNREALMRFRELRSAKPRSGANDLKIAAVVLVHDGVLVTRNSRDFKGLPNLTIENWC
jgi:tRNA(fMet)-specific endonuclease VapC